jgi:hypothetical protein
MSAWEIRCPFCWRLLLPADGNLHYFLIPRLVFHLYDAHPYEATTLRLRLEHPPAEWPVLEEMAA